MPKASSSQSHLTPASSANFSLPDPEHKDSSEKLKKRKNADAQAAFRARRANYISTLESTVTTLESVVLQLQTSCREEHSSFEDARAENARLKVEFRERENMWRTLWVQKKGGDADDLPPLPESLVASFSTSYPSPAYTSPPEYSPTQSPAISSAEALAYQPTAAVAPALPPPHRAHRYQPYPGTSSSTTSWSASYTTAPPPSPSSGYAYSTPGTPLDLTHASRFLESNQQYRHHSLGSVDAPYSFSDNRSTPSSTPSPPISVASGYGTTYPEPSSAGPLAPPQPSSSMQQSENLDYAHQSAVAPHRNSVPNMVPQNFTFHGGMANFTIRSGGPGSDALRQRFAPKREPPPTPERPSLPPLETGTSTSIHSPGANVVVYNGGELPANVYEHDDSASPPDSGSPTQEYPRVSDTVAVIKANSFGSFRRPRARRRTSEGMSTKQAAQDVLDARGLNPDGQFAPRHIPHQHEMAREDRFPTHQ